MAHINQQNADRLRRMIQFIELFTCLQPIHPMEISALGMRNGIGEKGAFSDSVLIRRLCAVYTDTGIPREWRDVMIAISESYAHGMVSHT